MTEISAIDSRQVLESITQQLKQLNEKVEVLAEKPVLEPSTDGYDKDASEYHWKSETNRYRFNFAHNVVSTCKKIAALLEQSRGPEILSLIQQLSFRGKTEMKELRIAEIHGWEVVSLLQTKKEAASLELIQDATERRLLNEITGSKRKRVGSHAEGNSAKKSKLNSSQPDCLRNQDRQELMEASQSDNRNLPEYQDLADRDDSVDSWLPPSEDSQEDEFSENRLGLVLDDKSTELETRNEKESTTENEDDRATQIVTRAELLYQSRPTEARNLNEESPDLNLELEMSPAPNPEMMEILSQQAPDPGNTNSLEQEVELGTSKEGNGENARELAADECETAGPRDLLRSESSPPKTDPGEIDRRLETESEECAEEQDTPMQDYAQHNEEEPKESECTEQDGFIETYQPVDLAETLDCPTLPGKPDPIAAMEASIKQAVDGGNMSKGLICFNGGCHSILKHPITEEKVEKHVLGHMRVMKPFLCSICSKKFVSRKAAENHVSKVHAEKSIEYVDLVRRRDVELFMQTFDICYP